MTDELNHEQEEVDDPPLPEPQPEQEPNSRAAVFSQLPGLMAIALYMLLLAGTVILGVALKHYPPLYLVFPALFIAAGLGLLMLFRWAWALSLAAALLLMAMFFYEFVAMHATSGLVQSLLNLVFFLYMIRAEVRQRLR